MREKGWFREICQRGNFRNLGSRRFCINCLSEIPISGHRKILQSAVSGLIALSPPHIKENFTPHMRENLIYLDIKCGKAQIDNHKSWYIRKSNEKQKCEKVELIGAEALPQGRKKLCRGAENPNHPFLYVRVPLILLLTTTFIIIRIINITSFITL